MNARCMQGFVRRTLEYRCRKLTNRGGKGCGEIRRGSWNRAGKCSSGQVVSLERLIHMGKPFRARFGAAAAFLINR